PGTAAPRGPRSRDRPCAGRPPDLPRPHRLGEPQARRLPGAPPPPGAGPPGGGVPAVPRAARAREAARRHAERRRAADARHRTRADGGPAAPDARRAVARPGAALRGSRRGDREGAERAGHRDPARRAAGAGGAPDRRARLRAGDRTHRARGRRRAPPRERGRQARLSGNLKPREEAMRGRGSVLLAVALTIGTVQAVPAQEPVRIGVVGPHSGPAAYDGQSTLIGAQVAAEEINQAGGLFKFAQTPRLESRFVDYWVKKLNVKKVAFLARNDDWGRATSGVYQARLKELGGTVLSSDFYTPGEKDFYSYLTKVKALNPEGINVVDISATAATQVKQMAELGLNAKPLGSDGTITDAFIRLAGKVSEGIPLVVRSGAALATPRNKAVGAAF